MPPSEELRRAAGKLITGKIAGTSVDTAHERAIADGVMTGVTLFKDNATSLEQLFELVSALHDASKETFFVAVDQEGGAVQRFDDVLTPLPSALALAALNDGARVRELMLRSAQQLRWLGVNCNLTPVLDVNSNPLNPIIATRSFGDDPRRVTELGLIVADAHLAAHVLPVGKHFPGHGDTSEDSHLSLAVAHGDKKRLHEREFKPFALAAGALPSMLVGHVWLPAYDEKQLPASLSYTVSTEILRNELGFDGWLLTDDLPVMRAIVDHWGLEEASVMAINAGADNLLVSGSIEQINSVHAALVRAIESAQISQSRLMQAIARREKALALTNPSDAGAALSPPAQRAEALEKIRASLDAVYALAASASEHAIAVVRGTLPDLSTDKSEWIMAAPAHPRYKLDLSSAISDCRGGACPALEEHRFTVDPSADEIEKIVGSSTGKNCILVTYRALLNKGQLRLAEQLAKTAKSLVVVASEVPYDLSAVPQSAIAVATFDPSSLAIRSAAKVLCGQTKPKGRLPVALTV